MNSNASETYIWRVFDTARAAASLIPYGGGDVRRRQAGKGIGAGGGQRRAEADGSSLETVSVPLRLYRCVEWCRR